MALKKQIKETKAAEVKAATETKEEVKTAVKAAEDKVSEKVEEVKETAKKEAQPKEVKATVEKKAQEVKKAAGEVKKTVEETAAKEVKKTAEKVTKEVKKAAPKTTAKKSAAKKEIKTEVVLQYGEKEVNTKDMIASVKKDWTKQKHKISEIKSIELYVKPEDYAVYYVINGEHTGKVWL